MGNARATWCCLMLVMKCSLMCIVLVSLVHSTCTRSMQATGFVHAKQYACILLAESYFALSYGMHLFVMLEEDRVTGWTIVARQYLF